MPQSRSRRGTQRTTMGDVALAAEVSPSTVSLFLRQPGAVLPATGTRIAQAIEKLNYVPNLAAGGLAAAQSKVVSIVVPSIRNAFFAATVDALQAALAVRGYQLLVGHTEYSPSREEAIVRASLAWGPAALVLTGLDHTPMTRRLIREFAVPVIEIWEWGETVIDMAVGFSHRDVGRAMARHLLDRGHRKIAFVGARLDDDRRAGQRAEGYAETVVAAGGQSLVFERPGAGSVEAGGILLERVIGEIPDLDALCCANDLMALGAIFACQRLGIDVPGRLAIMGFGNLGHSPFCLPPLSTIRPPGTEIGEKCGEMILRRIADGALPEEQRIIDLGFEVIARAST